jgi:hypothetical protein
MNQFLAPIISELQKNTRLRLGVWLIMALLMGYVVLVLNDYQMRLKRDYQEALSQLHQLQTMTTQSQWSQRASQTHELLGQWQARFWQADTKGLAQAMFQSWLQEELYFAQLADSRLQVETTVEVPNQSLWQVSAKLDAVFVPKRLYNFLLVLSTHPQLVVVERLEIQYSQVKPKFSLVMNAYFGKP